jgi:hypothetical protein
MEGTVDLWSGPVPVVVKVAADVAVAVVVVVKRSSRKVVFKFDTKKELWII